ncbi:TIR domain-containing protein [Agrobacterium rhizogenes]|nr:TIR domain-containing protein [Rhizobium rhizogenes]
MDWRQHYRYTAFISYSSRHVARARQLQSHIEKYRIPKPLVGSEGRWGPLPPSMGKCFLDRTDASSSPDLSAEIENALAASRILIVLCSPEVASPSSWANREIAAFRRLRPDGLIPPVVIADEPKSSFPPEAAWHGCEWRHDTLRAVGGRSS